MKLSGAVFDFDGTLFDTMSVWDTAGEDYLKQCGKVPRENLCEVLKPKSIYPRTGHPDDGRYG